MTKSIGRVKAFLTLAYTSEHTGAFRKLYALSHPFADSSRRLGGITHAIIIVETFVAGAESLDTAGTGHTLTAVCAALGWTSGWQAEVPILVMVRNTSTRPQGSAVTLGVRRALALRPTGFSRRVFLMGRKDRIHTEMSNVFSECS